MVETATIATPGNEPLYFCGAQPEQLNRARARVMRWNKKRELAWSIADRLAGVSVEFHVAELEWCFNQWHEASNGFFTFRNVANPAQADIIITTRRIDRQGGVLAEMQLPPGDDRQLLGWWDTSEVWTQPGFLRAVSLHELGHAMGLDHNTAELAVMNPQLNMALKGLLKSDIGALLGNYPEAVDYKPSQPAPTPATGAPGGPPESITINGFVATWGGVAATYGPAVHTRIL